MPHRFGFNAWPTREERELEHMLHLLWSLEEEGDQRLETVLSRWEHNDDPRPLIDSIVSEGLVVQEEDDFRLAEKGRKQAEKIVRRYRLAECLLGEVLLLDEDQYEKSACEFEHILTPEVTDSVCALLGHPPVCPHGRPIPKGPCCSKYQAEIQPLVKRLSDLSPGDVARVVFISSESHKQLDRLSSMGLIPGTILKLHQRQPSFILFMGETQLAIDRDIASEIFVKKVS
jgi:DtxR family Mn-dependent transcriptional regulator